MKKRVLCVLIFFGMMVALSACGSSETTVVQDSSVSTVKEETASNQNAGDAKEEKTEKKHSGTERKDNEDGSYIVYEYNDEGKKIKASEYSADGWMWLVTEYRDNGKKLKETLYYENGNIESFYDYDEEGKNQIRRTMFHEDGSPLGIAEWEYFENGNQRIQRSYNENNILEHEDERDENGNIIRTVSYDEEGNITESGTTEYDANGNMTRTEGFCVGEAAEYIKIGATYVHYLIEYDENGNTVKEEYTDENGNPI